MFFIQLKFQISYLKSETGRLEIWTSEELRNCEINRFQLDDLIVKLFSHLSPSHSVNFGYKSRVKIPIPRKMPLRRKSNEQQETNEPGEVERAMIFPDANTPSNSAGYQFCESQNIFKTCTLPYLGHLPDSRGFSSPTYSLEMQARSFIFI